MSMTFKCVMNNTGFGYISYVYEEIAFIFIIDIIINIIIIIAIITIIIITVVIIIIIFVIRIITIIKFLLLSLSIIITSSLLPQIIPTMSNWPCI